MLVPRERHTICLFRWDHLSSMLFETNKQIKKQTSDFSFFSNVYLERCSPLPLGACLWFSAPAQPEFLGILQNFCVKTKTYSLVSIFHELSSCPTCSKDSHKGLPFRRGHVVAPGLAKECHSLWYFESIENIYVERAKPWAWSHISHFGQEICIWVGLWDVYGMLWYCDV